MVNSTDARLTLRVPRGSRQDLHAEARERLRRTAVVDDVGAFDVTGVQPELNDLRVRVWATIDHDVVSETGLCEALSDVVGVEAVELAERESER